MPGMTLADFIASGPMIGSMVRYSDGTPRPPERFKNKLAAWKRWNSEGRLTEFQGKTVTSATGYPSRPKISLEDERIKLPGIASFTTVFGALDGAPGLRFEVIEEPKAGTVLVLSKRGETTTLHHRCASRAEAEAWVKAERPTNGSLSDGASICVVGEDPALAA